MTQTKQSPINSGRFSILIIIFLVGCATPAFRMDRLALDLGFAKSIVTGTDFKHVIYSNNSPFDDVVHVYVGGDGTPWLNNRYVSVDPTPRDPVSLRLMETDTKPSIYLGRPCYNGLFDQKACTPWFWTHGRYSEQVIDSMGVALRTVRASYPKHRLWIIGYSGGGTLAVLLAERFTDDTDVVITVAGNLDIEQWTQLHGYTPLTGSLNPISRPPLPVQVRQLHLIGGRDRNVIEETTRAYVAKFPAAEMVIYSDFDHSCCWADAWSEILERF